MCCCVEISSHLIVHALLFTVIQHNSYRNVVCAALDVVCDTPTEPGEAPIPTDTRLAFFNEMRHSYGRTALLLSGGATLGLYHFGVVKALMENRLMPRVLGGASAGSIVCAVIGTRTDEECMRDLFEMQGTHAPGHSGELVLNLLNPYYIPMKNTPPTVVQDAKNTKRTTWWPNFVPMSLRRFSSVAYDILTFKIRPHELIMSDTEHLRECLRKNTGEFTFQEAFDRTGRILNITGNFIAVFISA
jgi:TAG lipase/steryl ester hydrolase/phospholipase A2/LPA acyltransferase